MPKSTEGIRPCRGCGGDGFIMGPIVRGLVTTEICPECKGSGMEATTTFIVNKFPPKLKDGPVES